LTVVNSYTFQITTQSARLTLTFTRDGRLVTTSEYAGALVKRVGVIADRDEIKELAKWLADNMKVKPFPPVGPSDQ